MADTHHHHEQIPQINPYDGAGRGMLIASDAQRRAAGSMIQLTAQDLLAEPQPLADSNDAVLLTRVVVESPNSCHMAVKAYQIPGKTELDFVVICFVPDHHDTLKSKFSNPEPVLMQEIVRQLRATCTSPGDALFCMIIATNYFAKNEQEQSGQSEQFDDVIMDTAPVTADELPAAEAPSQLYPSLPPATSADNLL